MNKKEIGKLYDFGLIGFSPIAANCKILDPILRSYWEPTRHFSILKAIKGQEKGIFEIISVTLLNGLTITNEFCKIKFKCLSFLND